MMESAYSEIARIERDPACSYWLAQALKSALQRDPIDAANDAEVLAKVLRDRAYLILDGRAANSPK